MSPQLQDAEAIRYLKTSIFPLRFTPFEFFFLCDDRPEYPSIISIELDAVGRLDREALESAYQLAHIRHPILSARIETNGRGWPYWVGGTPQPIQFVCGGDEREGIGTPLLAGMKMRVREDQDRIRFQFAFRHVTVDGLGALQFIADLIVAYDHLCAGHVDAPHWRELEPERLRDRDGHRLFWRHLRPVDLLRMAQVHLPLSLRQAALVSDEKPAGKNDKVPSSLPTAFLVRHLTADETAALGRAAAKQSVMLNDLLVRDYFLMLAKWNSGTSQSRKPLRIMIPTNMRRREDLRMPSANVFSYAFLTRYATDCQDRERLLASIQNEMAAIKRNKLGRYYEAGVRLFCRWPAFLRWSLNRKWAFATAVFTNLGTGFNHIPLSSTGGHMMAGDLVFETGAGAGPIRPDTRISFAAHNYAGRLAITARCDPRSLTPSQQRALFDSYIEQLKSTIALES